MDGAIQGLPFRDLQQHVTRHLRYGPGQHGGIKDAPGNNAIERQAALQALGCPQLARFDATAAFQNPMPHLNAPATSVPLHTFDGVFDSVHRNGRQQQPRERFDVRLGDRLPRPVRPTARPRASLHACDAWADTSVTGQNRSATLAWRPGVGPRRGTCNIRGSTTGVLPPWPTQSAQASRHSGPTRRESTARRPQDAPRPTRRRHPLPDRQHCQSVSLDIPLAPCTRLQDC